MDHRVLDNPAQRRYEIWVGDQLAGFSRYQDRKYDLVFFHTEIDPAFEGQGLGGELVRGTLEDVRRRRMLIVARCPFFASYISRHREYLDVVEPSMRASFDEAPAAGQAPTAAAHEPAVQPEPAT
jgi:predicted GNAT family acetyltransferase